MATKKDLIEKLSKKITDISKEDINNSIDYILDYIKLELSNNNRIEIRGFGSFTIRNRKRAGDLKSYNTIYYRMAKNILDTINNGAN